VAVNRRILIQAAAPSIFLGLLLCGACLLTAWYVNRLHSNLADLLNQDQRSMSAAQDMEIAARQLRFRCYLYLIDPSPSLLKEINDTGSHFLGSWSVAQQCRITPRQKLQLLAVKDGYDEYQRDFDRLRGEVDRGGPRRDYRELAEYHIIRHVSDPCREYLRLSEETMRRHALDSELIATRLNWLMILLGIVAPVGGLISGYGLARRLSRTFHRLSVHVHDMARQLDHDVATIHLAPDGDIGELDRQLGHVVQRVGEVTADLRRQQNEMLRAQQLAAVGQLAAGVAHEIRNPLTSIKMLVEAALREQKPRPFTVDNLRVVHGEVLRLEQTIQGFLDFARPPTPCRKACDLRCVVTQALDLVRTRARQQKIDVEVDCPEEPVIAEVDAGQLRSVLVNLCVNALDAMPRGGRLTVRVIPSETGIRIDVADTGDGIAAEIAPKLFTPFLSTKETGTGLGLSISKRIMEEHGGRIDGCNQPDGGACFTVTLPTPKTESNHADLADH
jgi:signal transduction histidine kinase